MLTPSQEKFIEKRVNLNRRWSSGILLIFFMWYIAWIVMMFAEPYLANPWYYHDIDNNVVIRSSIDLLVSTAPFVITLFFFLGLLILGKWKEMVDIERHYFEIIESMKMNVDGNTYSNPPPEKKE